MPRIITGKARGIPLVAPPGQGTRPTADKTKEALFSILASEVLKARFLDLYAGTGQVGLEALSRGAAQAVLVENDRAAVAAIRKNRDKTRLEEGCRILQMDVARALQILRSEEQTFDIVFLDPPYALAAESLEKLAPAVADGLVRGGGTVILEHESSLPPPLNVTNLQLRRSCKYGTAMLSFYQVSSIKSPE